CQSHQVGENEATCQTERYRKQYGKRKNITFVLCTQQQINKYEAEDEDHRSSTAARTLFFTGHTREFISVSGRQRLFCHFLHGLDGLTGTVSVSRRTIDSHRRKHVETLDVVRSVNTFNAHKLSDRSHLVAVAYFNRVQ